MTRLPQLPPDQLSAEQRAVYDAIVGGKRSSGPQLFDLTAPDGSLYGPFNAMLVNPALGGTFQRVGEILRYESSLSTRVRELVILVVAQAWRCEFEWYAHSKIARHAGMPENVLAALHRGDRPDEVSGPEATAYDVCRALLRDRTVDDELYASATDEFGDRGVAELVFLFGYYTSVAAALNTFAVALPPGAESAFD
ncbi:MAG: carboxymuconolactone decarboxylase family protein [Streptosporangiales bacterium]|nr:carboxymuconolactone decarboxylase family protein [Streptosporangiales bacterium]